MFLLRIDHEKREAMRFARSQLIFWSALLLLLLAGCGSAGAILATWYIRSNTPHFLITDVPSSQLTS